MNDDTRTMADLRQALATAQARISTLERERSAREHSSASSRASSMSALAQDFFGVIVDHSQAIIFIVDGEGMFRLSEGAALSRLGLRPGEVVGQSVFELYADYPSILDGIRSGLAGNESTSEVQLATSVFDVFYSPYRSASGEVLGVLGLAVDVSERKKVEAELRGSQERLRRAQQVARVGFWEWSLADGVLKWSDELFDLYGLPQGTTPAIQTVRDLVHPEDLPELDAALASVNQPESRALPSIEYRIRRPDGEERVLKVWAHLDHDEQGRPMRVFGTVQDVTDSRLAQSALKESQQQLSVAFDSTADNLLLLDTQHRVQMTNRTAEVELSYPMLRERPLYELVPEEHQQRVKAHLDRAIETVQRQHYDVPYIDAEGQTRHYSVIASPIIVAGEVTGTLVSSRDETERVRLEATQRQLEEQTRQSQKMEAIGRLAGGVAHDFNNALCVIAGNAEQAMCEVDTSDGVHSLLEEISQAADRAAELTRQLLAFSRKQVIAPKVVDLNFVVQSLRSMLVRLIGEHIDLSTRTASSPAMVCMDPNQIEQIVLNLVVNARDAMPNGGEVRLETRNVTLDANYCAQHLSVQPGNYVALSVRDTGHGIKPEVRDKIFEPFFTTKAMGRGTGLGLATVFGIAEQSGLHIDVRSEPEQGADFRIYFPRASGESASAEPVKATYTTGGTETILVAEDEEMVRVLAQRLLSRSGYHVLVARTGEEAIQLCESYEGPVDLLLTDVVMPGIDGAQLAAQLCAARPQMRVLFTSGYPDDVIANRGVLDEGIQFLPKPYTRATLSQKVREVLDLGRAATLSAG